MISNFYFQALYRFFFPARVPVVPDDDDDYLDGVHVEGGGGGPPGPGGPGGANVPLAPGDVRDNVKAPEPQVNNLGSC